MTLQGALEFHGNNAGWPETPLRALLRRIDHIGDVNLPLLGVGLHEGIRRRDDNDGRPAASENLSAYKIVRQGDVIMNRLGKPHGSVGVSPWRGITSPAYWVMEIDRSRAYPTYIHHLLRSKHLVREYERLGKHMPPNQFDISWEVFRSIEVPLPSLDEQCRIADFLDAETAFVDKIHVLRSQQKEQLIQRRWSVFQYALDTVPKESLPLRRLLHSVIDGPFGSAFSSSDYVDDGAVVVRLGNIGFCEYRPEDQARIPIPLYSELRKHDVREGDILIAGLGDPRNHAGRACIAPDLGPAIVKGKCFRARVERARTSAEFLVLLLSSPLGAAILEGRGSTRSMINLEIVKSAVLPIPRYADQVAIADEMSRYWQSALAVVQACDRQLALIAERRQALITAAVTGQIDVTTARGLSSSGGVAV